VGPGHGEYDRRVSREATLWRNARIATLADAAGWGLLEDGAILTDGGGIRWVGKVQELPDGVGDVKEVDLGGACVTPGLIDCHTHLVYAGNRANELELRLGGASYEEVAGAGGGIRSTVVATRAAGDEELLRLAEDRLVTLAAEGVTTVEIKSGYGLSADDEARCLRVARALGRTGPATVRTTYLGAHAVPPEYDGRADEYVDAVCAWLPALHEEGLVDAVDAFCERIAFSPDQTRRVFAAAKALGLPVRLHADQLSDLGGAALAAEAGALSADHLEYTSADGAAAMGPQAPLPCSFPVRSSSSGRRRCRRSMPSGPIGFRSRSPPTTTPARLQRCRSSSR